MSEAWTQKILVADDDQDILELVCFRLEMSGHETIRACDGAEAVELAELHLPALCILDVQMPRLTGFEVLQALRGQELTARLPVILLTASVQDSDVARGFEYGADAYLRKPFDPRELESKVTTLLSRTSERPDREPALIR